MIDKSDIQKTLAVKIGACVASLRKQAGKTQGELAEQIGVDTETISRFERGATMPSLVTLQLLAVALNTTMGDLVGDSSPMPNEQARIISGWLGELQASDRALLMDMLKQLCARLRNE
jgi:transcriptional regulator with XRE-family HTH domain